MSRPLLALLTLCFLLAVLAIGAAAAAPSRPVWGVPGLAGHLPPQSAQATELLTVDLNGDGLLDAVVGAWNSTPTADDVRPVFLLNHGDGRFTDATQQLFSGPAPTEEGNPDQILSADFNRDGRADIFIVDGGYHTPTEFKSGKQQRLILSTADGHLVDASANLPEELTFARSAAVGDVNGDGAPDIFENNLTCCSLGHVGSQVLLNDGSGHFSVEPDGILSRVRDQYGNDHSYSCLLADVNGDGSFDLVLGGTEVVDSSQVLLNDGHGRFTFFERLPPTIGPAGDGIVTTMKAADVNGDGSPDLVFGETLAHPSWAGTSVQVLINDGHGHFADETATRMPEEPQARRVPQRVLMDDLDDDGHPDLTIEFTNRTDVPKDPTAVYLNRGGVFRRVESPAEGPQPEDGGPVGWVNGDGPHALLSIEYRDKGQASAYFVTPQLLVPTAPTRVRATRTAAGVRITWAAVAQASHYQVRRDSKLIAVTTATTYLDPHPRKHIGYTIRATNAAGSSTDSPRVRPHS